MPASAGQLVDAAKAGDAARIVHLINSGADVHERGPQGDTALHWAAFHGRETIVAQLIARGADVDVAVDNGSTPLHQAAYRGHTGVVELLILQGAELNHRTANGVTPLGWAKRNGHSAVMQVLLAHGGRYGVASASDSALSRRIDTLPDAVLFAALSYLPSLQNKPVPAAAPPEQSRRLAEFRVQLAAMRSEAHAREMWQQYLTRHPTILGGLAPTLVPARVNGVPFYRVQGGPLTEVTARSVCDELTRDNQACMVVRVSAVTRP